MKTLKCDLCEATAQGETFKAWVEALKPHYAKAHDEVMAGKGALSPEEQKESMGKWMAENKARFEEA